MLLLSEAAVCVAALQGRPTTERWRNGSRAVELFGLASHFLFSVRLPHLMFVRLTVTEVSFLLIVLAVRRGRNILRRT